MKGSSVGAVILVITAVALIAFTASEPPASEESVTAVASPRVRPNRPTEFKTEPGVAERRALGKASLATRGQPSMRRVTVDGFVRSPGPVAWDQGLTLRAAIGQAGGPTDFGSIRRVKLIRDGNLTQFNLRDEKVGPVGIEPGDTIEIPQKMLLPR